jgi:hypothetical protein
VLGILRATPYCVAFLNIWAAFGQDAIPKSKANEPGPPKSAGLDPRASPQSKLWLAIGVDKLIYQLDEVSRLEIFFAVVNDGDATIDPGIGSSHLLINGVEAKGWSLIVTNGPLASIEFNALPPGHPYLFGKQLGSVYFGEPGIYKVRWRVGAFSSPEITFRVMPAPLIN